MKLSAQEEYGLRCLLHMARRDSDKIHTIPEISHSEGLSSHHVAKLMRILRRGGLVSSARGQTGGYRLSTPPNQISVGVVLRVLGGQMFGPGFCERHAGLGSECKHRTDCSMRALWESVQTSVDRILDNTTLQDLLGDELRMRGELRVGGNGSRAHTSQEHAVGSRT
jgi:Rrf2 family protein